MLMLTLVLSLLVALGNGQDTSACDLNQEALMKTAMECVAHDPKLMLEIIEHMKNPDEMANMKFVCSNQHDLVDVAMCIVKKLAICLPQEVQPMILQLLSQDRLEAVLKFACEHQAELLDPCMDDNASQMLSTCVQSETVTLTAALSNPSQLSTLDAENMIFCRFSSMFKKCLAANHGSCSKAYTDVFTQIFELMLPEHHCNGKQMYTKTDLTNKLLGSLLLHGEPMSSKLAGRYGSQALRFKPRGH